MIDQARDELSAIPPSPGTSSRPRPRSFLLILAVNRVGDAVRDVLDPRTARRSGDERVLTVRELTTAFPGPAGPDPGGGRREPPRGAGRGAPPWWRVGLRGSR